MATSYVQNTANVLSITGNQQTSNLASYTYKLVWFCQTNNGQGLKCIRG